MGRRPEKEIILISFGSLSGLVLLFSASSHGKKASVFFLGAYAYVRARVCVCVCVPTKASKLRASQVVVIVDVRERKGKAIKHVPASTAVATDALLLLPFLLRFLYSVGISTLPCLPVIISSFFLSSSSYFLFLLLLVLVLFLLFPTLPLASFFALLLCSLTTKTIQ